MPSTTETKIWRYLKSHRGFGTILGIADTIHEDPARVAIILNSLVKKGYLRMDRDGYRIVRWLEPPMKENERMADGKGVWNYSKIMERIERAATPSTPSSGPDSLLPKNHPFEPYLPHGWMQGERGTCVGHAMAILSQCNYYALVPDHRPTKEQMAQYQENCTEPVWGQCIMIYDRWYETVFSPQYAYHTSRVYGNLSIPSGSYLSAAIAAAKEYGAVPWDECLTSKTPACAPQLYPDPNLDSMRQKGRPHEIDGYAKITDWVILKRTIKECPAHCVVMPINCFAQGYDYQYNLILGDPYVDLTGSHALPWLFVDETMDRIGCWNSWGHNYPQVTWINEKYWKAAGGVAFVSLDKEEVHIAKQIYSKVTIQTNAISFNVSIGDMNWYGQVGPLTVMLEQSKPIKIKVVPLPEGQYFEPYIERECIFREYLVTETFNFTPKPKVGLPDWAIALIEKAKTLFQKIMNNF